jgi:tetratricopeptide (TPR) repeat protein
MLVVLDNARDVDQVRPLLPGSPGCLTVVTSRSELTGLLTDGAHPVPVDLLTTAEATALLARRLGQQRVDSQPEAAQKIVERCGRLPLALALVCARAAAHPGFALADLAAELAAADRLDALAGADGDTDLRAVFFWSYQALRPAAAELFRLLGLHPGPTVSPAAMASLAGVPVAEARRGLAGLVAAHLAAEPVPGRYALHDLLRAYAADLTASLDPEPQRQAATRRMLDHYLHTAHAAAAVLYPQRDPITPAPPTPGVVAERPAGEPAAMGWFAAEHQVLLPLLDLAAATGLDGHVWQLAWTMRDYLNWRGHWLDWVATQTAAVAAAQRLADPAGQALAHRSLARAYTELGRYPDARTHLDRALQLAEQLADHTTAAHIHLDLSRVHARTGDHPAALRHAEAALASFQAAGHRTGHALALNAVGWCHALLGHHTQALTHCQHALTIHQQTGNRWGEADTWDSLGYAHHHLGQHTDAIDCYQHAADLYQDIGDRYGQATIHEHLGDAHHAAGNPHAAAASWQQALDMLTALAHPDTGRLRHKLDPPTDPR